MPVLGEATDREPATAASTALASDSFRRGSSLGYLAKRGNVPRGFAGKKNLSFAGGVFASLRSCFERRTAAGSEGANGPQSHRIRDVDKFYFPPRDSELLGVVLPPD